MSINAFLGELNQGLLKTQDDINPRYLQKRLQSWVSPSLCHI